MQIIANFAVKMSNEIENGITGNERIEILPLVYLLTQFLIVLLHQACNFYIDVYKTGHTLAEFPMTKAFCEWISVTLQMTNVVFLTFSGMLFFRGYEAAGAYRRKILRRTRTLVWPYLLWNFLASPWFTAMLIPVVGAVLPSIGTARPMSVSEAYLGLSPGWFPANAPLWFMRNLMGALLLAPLIWRCVRTRYGWWLPLACEVALMWGISCGWEWSAIPETLVGVSLGAWLTARRVAIRKVPGCLVIAAVFAVMAGGAVSWHWPASAVWLVPLIQGGEIIGIIGVAQWLLARNWGAAVLPAAGVSFFLYLTHIIGRSQISEFVLRLVKPHSDAALLCAMLAGYLAIVVFWTTIGIVLLRYTPRMYRLLTGGTGAAKG